MPTLLIIDDERNVLYSLEKGLREPDVTIVTAETASQGIEAAARCAPDVVLLDVQLPDLSGLETLEHLREQHRKTPVILMTAHGTADTAIEAMKRGAFDYILKPWRLADLKELVHRAFEAGRLSRVPASFDQEQPDDDETTDRIVGRSAAMQEVFKEIGRIAAQDVNVLILGESGAGKELVARAIYYHSHRNEKPFLALNCAALPDSLLESELFGHEKGAFTGADRRRIGRFEQADGGTLFLDEIGELSPATQAKLLRVLQDGRFERVGGNETITADVRVLAATNRDLSDAIERKEFRQDLYYRLNTFTIALPPLRERREDIPLLVEHFLKRDRRKLGIEVLGLSPDAMNTLRDFDWPGNVRQLQSAVRYALVHASSEVIHRADLPPELSVGRKPVSAPLETPPPRGLEGDDAAASSGWPNGLRQRIHDLLADQADNLHDKVHAEVDRVLLEEVLRHVDGHQTRAAELLGISRTTLRARLQQLGLVIEKAVQAKDDDHPADTAGGSA